MRISSECIPCLMKRVQFQTELVPGCDAFGIVSDSLKTLSEEADRKKKSVDVASKVHMTCYAGLSCKDPYRDLKIRSDEVAKSLIPIAEDSVENSDDQLLTSLKVAVAGNIMDFGMGKAIDSPDEFESVFSGLMEQEPYIDDSDVIRASLDKPGTIVYVFDNCGECQFDRILIRYLRSRGKRIVGIVRGEPILNDVTEEDAERSGLMEDLDLLLTTGKFYVGIDWPDIPDEVRTEIENCDLMIAKGMGNYESLSDSDMPVPVIHVLRAKCRPVADSIGVPLNSNVIYARCLQ